MNQLINEILFEISMVSDDPEEQVMFLHLNRGPVLETILLYAYNDDIQFYRNTIPPGYQPDGDSPPDMGYTNLYNEWKMLRYFVKGYVESDRLPEKKKDTMLLQLLESMEANEADVIVQLITGNFEHTYHLPKDVVKVAFPKLLSN